MRPKRNDEVVETIAGIVCSDNNGSILPVIFSGMFETAVLTSLDKNISTNYNSEMTFVCTILEITMSVINVFLGYKCHISCISNDWTNRNNVWNQTD